MKRRVSCGDWAELTRRILVAGRGVNEAWNSGIIWSVCIAFFVGIGSCVSITDDASGWSWDVGGGEDASRDRRSETRSKVYPDTPSSKHRKGLTESASLPCNVSVRLSEKARRAGMLVAPAMWTKIFGRVVGSSTGWRISASHCIDRSMLFVNRF